LIKFKIGFSALADKQMGALELDKSKKAVLKQVNKVLGYMETNLKHPSLNTHTFDTFQSPFGGEVFETYAQNNTPGAYRIFWVYGPEKKIITILAITPHP
jgi:hypothetical protein